MDRRQFELGGAEERSRRMGAPKVRRGREPLVPFSVRMRRNALWFGVGGVALLLGLTVAWVAGTSAEQSRILGEVARQFDAGELESARSSLDELGSRRFLPVPLRRKIATYYFRLGDDVAGHVLLRGISVRPGETEDSELQGWSNRCLRASNRLRRADASQNTAERVRLIQEAAEELPDAPRVLERLVEEELLAMTRTSDSRYEDAFQRHYLLLRLKAPKLAGQVKQRVAAQLVGGRESSRQ